MDEENLQESAITALGAPGGAVVRVFHGGHADLHSKELIDVTLKVWAARWSPWPSIVRGLALQRDQKGLSRASPLMGCMWCLVFRHTSGKGSRLFPYEFSLWRAEPFRSWKAVRQVKSPHRKDVPLLWGRKTCTQGLATGLLLWKNGWKTSKHMALGGSLSLPGCLNKRKSWITALWTHTPCWNGHLSCCGAGSQCRISLTYMAHYAMYGKILL